MTHASSPFARAGDAVSRLSVFQILVLTNLGLTLLYYLLGYLYEPWNRVVTTDSAHYYMYLRSLFFDLDIDFSNEILHYYDAERLRQLITVTGLPGNQWSVGPAIFWSPFFLLAHGLTLLARAFGADLAADGYSYFYGLLVYLANWVYALSGFYFLGKVLERFCSRAGALFAGLSVMLASQLTYYFWPDTAMAHNTAFFATCLYLWLLLSRGVAPQTLLAAALAFLTRWQAVIYLAPLGAFALRDILQTRNGRGRLLLRQAGLAALFFLAVSPQLLVWKTLYGAFFTVPHGGHFVDLRRLQLFNALFSLWRGIFTWHPALLLGCAGLFLLARRDRWLGWSAILAVCLQIFFISSLYCWWAGWSFGQRFFIEALPFLALGFGLVHDALAPRRPLRLGLIALILLLAVWNQLNIFQYQKGLIPREFSVSAAQFFGDKLVLGQRLDSKRALRKALAALNAQDLQAAARHAAAALKDNPSEERALMVAGYCGLLAKDEALSGRAFAALLALYPENALYARGLAASRAPAPPLPALLDELQARMLSLVNG
jgi:hypothetical protein